MTHVMQVAEMALAIPKKNVLNSAEPMTGVVLRDTAFVAPVIDITVFKNYSKCRI